MIAARPFAIPYLTALLPSELEMQQMEETDSSEQDDQTDTENLPLHVSMVEPRDSIPFHVMLGWDSCKLCIKHSWSIKWMSQLEYAGHMHFTPEFWLQNTLCLVVECWSMELSSSARPCCQGRWANYPLPQPITQSYCLGQNANRNAQTLPHFSPTTSR